MHPALIETVDAGVAVLTFNRPDAANTWSVDLHVAYGEALTRLATDPDVRAVVITGAGRHFCAGADISLLDYIEGGGDLPVELSAESFLTPLDFPKPLIAAVNGAAAGLGLINALLCDVRFASDRAIFTTAFTRRGLVAEHGISWLLPQIVGRAHSLDLLLSARRVAADEALDMGLVTTVVPAGEELDAAVAYARDLADNCSPAAMSIVKQQVTRHAVMELFASEAETVDLVEQSLLGPDFTEGVRSFVDRRQAEFAPLGNGSIITAPWNRRMVADVADDFFAATQANDWPAALALLAPDARLTTYPGVGELGVDGLSASWSRMREVLGPWEYSHVRRLVTADGFCEQHLVRFVDLDVEIEACVVARVDDQGLITRLEEYADGQALADARRRHREQLAGQVSS